MNATEVRSIAPQQRTTLPAPAGASFVREQILAEGKLWVGVVTTQPGAASPWHHHGDHQTYAYVLEGEATVEVADRRIRAEADGSLHVIPAGLPHRELNEGSTPNKILIIRIGEGPTVVPIP